MHVSDILVGNFNCEWPTTRNEHTTWSSSYDFQYALHMRSITHCVCLAGCARLPQQF